ncbi:MAG: alanine racemase, partial [Clostridia bacterium]|nr:alanine racemase [Clostridia bacterium]
MSSRRGHDPEGVITHYAHADEGGDGEAYTRRQYENFLSGVRALAYRGVSFRIRHCANSAAIFDYPDLHLDMVRAGVVLYGLRPSGEVKRC